jgi:hypothetical protein
MENIKLLYLLFGAIMAGALVLATMSLGVAMAQILAQFRLTPH